VLNIQECDRGELETKEKRVVPPDGTTNKRAQQNTIMSVK
jgi:hypothetical protein